LPPKRRKIRKRGKSGRGGSLILLVLLAVVALTLYQGYRWTVADLQESGEKFLARVAAGDREGAAGLASVQEEELQKLVAFFREEEVAYAGIGRVRLTGLGRGEISFNFNAGGDQFSAPLLLKRRGQVWRVDGLPQVEFLEGALVKEVQGDRLAVLWQGRELFLEPPPGSSLKPGAVFGGWSVEKRLVLASMLDELVLSRLILRSGTTMEGEREGRLPLRPNYSVYKVDRGQIAPGTPGDLVVGQEQVALYLVDGEVVAAKLQKPYSPEQIRVNLRADIEDLSRESLYHSSLRCRGSQGLIVEDRLAGRSYNFPAGEMLILEPQGEEILLRSGGGTELLFKHRIYISSPSEGRIILSGIRRAGWGSAPPEYRGTLEVSNLEGSLVLVNELPLEQYLYTVVPSEMPLAFGLEALKAQAVAARAFAYASMLAGEYSSTGAHVDDSVLSQVYNNFREYPLSSRAVEETAGLVPFYGGQVIQARFFSTSCGHTANAHEVWPDATAGEFPSQPVPYLTAQSQIPGVAVQLQGEDQVRQFLQISSWPAYDQASPYFRWEVDMAAEELEESINRNLLERYREQPQFVLTKVGEKEFRSEPLGHRPLGRLLDIRVVERGEGGNLMILEVEGTGGTYRIVTEYNIRFTFRPVQYLPGRPPVILKCHDGSQRENYPVLPSAFACFELSRDGEGQLRRIKIIGGGNGHGVGMSQYGARGMAEAGFNFREIIQHFFPHVTWVNIYEQ